MSLPESKYLIDTSLFTQAKRSYYAFDIAPSFWNHILKLSNQNIIISVDKVFDEIKRGRDDLFDWIKNNLPKNFFSDTNNSPSIITEYQKLINWSSQNPQFSINAKNEFAIFEEADPWLIAFAIENKLSIVSQEVFDSNIKRKIPIPNVCSVFNIRHIDTFTFLRECGFSM